MSEETPNLGEQLAALAREVERVFSKLAAGDTAL
jgi:hypothetical protein